MWTYVPFNTTESIRIIMARSSSVFWRAFVIRCPVHCTENADGNLNNVRSTVNHDFRNIQPHLRLWHFKSWEWSWANDTWRRSRASRRHSQSRNRNLVGDYTRCRYSTQKCNNCQNNRNLYHRYSFIVFTRRPPIHTENLSNTSGDLVTKQAADIPELSVFFSVSVPVCLCLRISLCACRLHIDDDQDLVHIPRRWTHSRKPSNLDRMLLFQFTIIKQSTASSSNRTIPICPWNSAKRWKKTIFCSTFSRTVNRAHWSLLSTRTSPCPIYGY